MTNTVTKDWVDRLLEDVADDLADSYIADQGYEQAEFPNLSRVADKLLKNRLRPLLLVGQAMADHARCHSKEYVEAAGPEICTHGDCVRQRAWDAAVKVASESR